MLNFVNARWARCAGLIVMGLIVVGGARLLMFGGVYGIALFVAIPMILGALAECFRKSASAGGAAMAGALTVLVANIALLVVAWEGVICIAMSLPLTVALDLERPLFTQQVSRRDAARPRHFFCYCP